MGRNGWILPEITPQSIANMLRECLHDPAGCRRHRILAEWTRDLVLSRWDANG